MANILIAYGSTTGNTEMVAEQIEGLLEAYNPKLQDITSCSPEDLTAYDILILGASTWDDGLLQSDFRDFVKDLKIDLSGKKLAIFGLGDTSYPEFCESANILEEIFTKLGGELLVETLKIDGFPDDSENVEKIEQWCEQIKSQL
jgi:flavodoxin I